MGELRCCPRCGLTVPKEGEYTAAQWEALRIWCVKSGSSAWRGDNKQRWWHQLRCRSCGVESCRQHWLIYAAFDAGYFDGTDGICPAGHRNVDVRT